MMANVVMNNVSKMDPGKFLTPSTSLDKLTAGLKTKQGNAAALDSGKKSANIDQLEISPDARQMASKAQTEQKAEIVQNVKTAQKTIEANTNIKNQTSAAFQQQSNQKQQGINILA